MRVFDSISSNKWSGKNFKLDNDRILILKSAKMQHSIDLRKGRHTLKLVGRKRAGNGKVNLKIESEDGTVLFEKSTVFSKTSWTEYTFSFDVNFNHGRSFLRITRDKNMFGNLEFGRIILDGSKEAPKREAVRPGINNRSPTKSKDNIQPVPFKFPSFYKKSIAFIVPYGIYGGAEVYIKNLISELDDNSYNITIIYMQNNALQSQINYRKIEHKLVPNLEHLKGTLLTMDFDFIVFYNRADIYKELSSLVSEKNIKSRLIEIYHSDFQWPGSISKIKERKNVDLIFSVSSKLANDISGVENKITLPVGIDLDLFQKRKSSPILKKVLPKKEAVIGTVARLSREKNVGYIVDLAKAMPSYLFVIVGDGPEKSKLLRAIEKFNLDNLVLTGFRTDTHLYYNIFDAFILPSKIEGTPISILEAMASEVPVFSTMVGAIPDIIKVDETGFEITGDVLVDANTIKNGIYREDVIQAAKNYVLKNHDIKKNVDIFLKALLDMEKFYVRLEDYGDVIILDGEFI